jgi:hypothetical protein
VSNSKAHSSSEICVQSHLMSDCVQYVNMINNAEATEEQNTQIQVKADMGAKSYHSPLDV